MTYLFTKIKHLTEEAVSVIGIIKGKKGTDHQIKLDALHLIRSEDLHLEATRCDLTLWISSSNCYIIYISVIYICPKICENGEYVKLLKSCHSIFAF